MTMAKVEKHPSSDGLRRTGMDPGAAEKEREIKMKNNRIAKSATFAAAAFAALSLAPAAHAVGWCPTPADNKITCSRCSRELTCDVNGFTLYIVGDGVTLDGKNHWLTYSSNDGIKVQGFAATIRYVNIQNPFGEGIRLEATTWDGSTPTSIDHVYITGAGRNGIISGGVNSTSISYSSVYYSNWSGIHATGPRNTDLRRTTSNHANSTGYLALGGQGNNSMILNSVFSQNSFGGLDAHSVSGMVISNDTLYQNGDWGLTLQNASGTVKNNYGRNNYQWDCHEYHDVPVSLSHSGNNWGSYSGSGCL